MDLCADHLESQREEHGVAEGKSLNAHMDPGGGRKGHLGIVGDAFVVRRAGDVRIAGRTGLEQLQPRSLFPVGDAGRHVEAEEDVGAGEFLISRLRLRIEVLAELGDVVEHDFVEHGPERVDDLGQLAVNEARRQMQLVGGHTANLTVCMVPKRIGRVAEKIAAPETSDSTRTLGRKAGKPESGLHPDLCLSTLPRGVFRLIGRFLRPSATLCPRFANRRSSQLFA